MRGGTNGIDGENRENRENREDREFKELRERLSLNSLNSLNSLISYFNQHTDFSSEVPRFVTKSKLHWKGVYRAYISFQGNELGAKVGAYHEKFTRNKFVVRRGQIWLIAKEDPLGIAHLVQPEGSYF